MYRSRNDAQKCLTECFKLGASSCRDERGNLLTDAQGPSTKTSLVRRNKR